MLRTVLAVVIGVVLWGGLWNGSYFGLKSAMPGSFDEQGMPSGTGIIVLFLAISALCSLVAGYSAAWISAESPMRAVWILAFVNLAIGVFVQTQNWNAFPLWYHVGLLGLVLPLHWLGGTLRTG